MKVTIADLKRRLAVGTEFTAEFIGKNRHHCQPGMEVTRRKVTKQTSEMASEFLDGPKQSQLIWLTWKGITADERDGSIYLSMEENDEFLKITI